MMVVGSYSKGAGEKPNPFTNEEGVLCRDHLPLVPAPSTEP